MTATKKYIEQLREFLAKEIKAKPEDIKDNQIQRILGIASSTMSRYNTEQSQADDDVAIIIAQYIGVPPMQIIGEIKAEQARKEETKNWWIEQSKKAVGAFMGAAILSATLAATPTNSFASSKMQDSIYYTNFD
ncbi:hypothetical protein [Thiomicrorhabdus cannonii]|uniref:hypothetical protein n=1 Tax=Thiomicrorhabdus cannonii TaxID=2748011 RepID=UPI0015BE68CB|nr:hypothetical protein [Thiomicrorhabdus cannonii]